MGGEAKEKMHGLQTFCSHKDHHKFNTSSEIVNPNITLFTYRRLGHINSPLTSYGLLLGSPKNSL